MPATSLPPLPGTNPRSSPATRAAAVWRMLKPFHDASLPAEAASRTTRGERQYGETVGARVCALPHDHHRMGSALQYIRERVLAVCDLFKGIRPGTQIFVGVGKIDLGADEGDFYVCSAPTLADASIENRRFKFRIGADDQNRVGLLDAFDR